MILWLRCVILFLYWKPSTRLGSGDLACKQIKGHVSSRVQQLSMPLRCMRNIKNLAIQIAHGSQISTQNWNFLQNGVLVEALSLDLFVFRNSAKGDQKIIFANKSIRLFNRFSMASFFSRPRPKLCKHLSTSPLQRWQGDKTRDSNVIKIY